MPELQPIQLVFTIPLDYSAFFDPQLLGAQWQIPFGEVEAYLELPHLPPGASSTGCPLHSPTLASKGIAKLLKNGWGEYYQEGVGLVAQVHAIMIVVKQMAIIEDEFANNVVDAPSLTETRKELSQWFDSFVCWLWSLTSQSLDAASPDPMQLNRKSRHFSHVLHWETGSSLPSLGTPHLLARFDVENSASERIINNEVMRRAIPRSVEGSPSIALELFAAARMASRYGHRRRAMLDIGTVCEFALTRLLQRFVDRPLPLGALAKAARDHSIPLAADFQVAVVNPRNDAVHRGVSPTKEIVVRALESCEELLGRVEPDLIRSSTLRAVNRPSRADLIIVQRTPPSKK